MDRFPKERRDEIGLRSSIVRHLHTTGGVMPQLDQATIADVIPGYPQVTEAFLDQMDAEQLRCLRMLGAERQGIGSYLQWEAMRGVLMAYNAGPIGLVHSFANTFKTEPITLIEAGIPGRCDAWEFGGAYGSTIKYFMLQKIIEMCSDPEKRPTIERMVELNGMSPHGKDITREGWRTGPDIRVAPHLHIDAIRAMGNELPAYIRHYMGTPTVLGTHFQALLLQLVSDMTPKADPNRRVEIAMNSLPIFYEPMAQTSSTGPLMLSVLARGGLVQSGFDPANFAWEGAGKDLRLIVGVDWEAMLAPFGDKWGNRHPYRAQITDGAITVGQQQALDREDWLLTEAGLMCPAMAPEFRTGNDGDKRVDALSRFTFAHVALIATHTRILDPEHGGVSWYPDERLLDSSIVKQVHDFLPATSLEAALV